MVLPRVLKTVCINELLTTKTVFSNRIIGTKFFFVTYTKTKSKVRSMASIKIKKNELNKAFKRNTCIFYFFYNVIFFFERQYYNSVNKTETLDLNKYSTKFNVHYSCGQTWITCKQFLLHWFGTAKQDPPQPTPLTTEWKQKQSFDFTDNGKNEIINNFTFIVNVIWKRRYATKFNEFLYFRCIVLYRNGRLLESHFENRADVYCRWYGNIPYAPPNWKP